MTRRALRGPGMFVQRGVVPVAAVAAPPRRAVIDVLGLACYIVWSFAFWNGPLLPAVEGGQAGMLLLLQGIATCLAALAIALGSGLLGPAGRGVPLLVILACVSTGSVVLAVLGSGEWRLDEALGSRLCPQRGGQLPASGVGRSGISVQGVRSTRRPDSLRPPVREYVAFGVLMLLPVPRARGLVVVPLAPRLAGGCSLPLTAR